MASLLDTARHLLVTLIRSPQGFTETLAVFFPQGGNIVRDPSNGPMTFPSGVLPLRCSCGDVPPCQHPWVLSPRSIPAISLGGFPARNSAGKTCTVACVPVHSWLVSARPCELHLSNPITVNHPQRQTSRHKGRQRDRWPTVATETHGLRHGD